MVLEYPHSDPLIEHTEYLGRRTRLSLRPPTTPTREDGIFVALRRAIPKPKAQETSNNAWILTEMWRILDKRVSAQQGSARDQSLIQRLGRAINASLQGGQEMVDRGSRRGDRAATRSEPTLHKEAWHQMKGWYRDVVDHGPPPTRVNLDQITAERVDLYRQVPPRGENISVDPFQVEYLVPTDEEIDWVVMRLRNNRSGGTSGMRVEHLKEWIA